MRALTNILTGSSVATVSQDVAAYQSAVAAHVGGDWSQHTQMRLYATPYAEPITGHTVASATLLRIQLTGTNSDGSGDGVFTVPVINSNVATNPGGAPIIIQEPFNSSVYIGSTAGFKVVVISAVAVTYQWRKDGSAIAGATSSVYLIGSAALTDQGAYSVVITNAYGSVTSVSAVLTVTPVPPETSTSGGGGFDFGNFIELAIGVPPPLIE